MKIKMSNLDIYNNAIKLRDAFGNNIDIKIPIMVNYAIQKNLEILLAAAKTVDKVRCGIGEKYGNLSTEGEVYEISKENLDVAKHDLATLMETEEMLDIRKIKLADLDGVQLSNTQMAALLFMIEEE